MLQWMAPPVFLFEKAGSSWTTDACHPRTAPVRRKQGVKPTEQCLCFCLVLPCLYIVGYVGYVLFAWYIVGYVGVV